MDRLVSRGDLLFYDGHSTDFGEAVVAVTESNQYFHVAIISDENEVIEAVPDGVVVQTVQGTIYDHEPKILEICRMQMEEEMGRTRAGQRSATKVGLPYNDVFSADCINSEGKESYYCSQLITEAYKEENIEWPHHTLNFCDTEGKLIDYWKEYYEKRGREVPQGEEGSHPAKLRKGPLQLVIRILPVTKMGGLKEVLATNARVLYECAHWIGGHSVEFSQNTKRFDVFEPRSGSKLMRWEYATAEQVEKIVDVAKEAQTGWAASSWNERSEVLRKTAELLRVHSNEIAHWESIDNGKPIWEAKADVLSCVDTFNFYSGIAHDLLGRHVPLDASRYAYTKRIPVGVVACIGAWNYPIQTCTWKTAPALACGNSVVYKPSPLCPISALILGRVLKEAGLPDGVFNVLQGDATTATALIENENVSKVSFTGSIPTGKKIMKAAAERNIKPVTLELGGKSSLIVFDDADVDDAVVCAMMANFFSQGQVCSNASKVLVHKSILADFTAKLVEKTSKMTVGDPLDETTRVGAHVSAEHRDKVEQYIEGAVAQGAQKLLGGDRVSVDGLEQGYYLSPCILADVTQEMTVYKEEIFGSVLLIIPFDEEKEAIRMANDTKMGLAAGIVTKDLARTHRVVEQLNAGNVYVNTYNDVSPLVPFGGIGESGFGRENGTAVLEHYTHVKSVFINTGRCDNPF